MILDKREWLLLRLQDALRTVAPGVVYAFPDGLPHRAIVSDLSGRVYSKVRSQARTDADEMPYGESLTSGHGPDAVQPLDSDLYAADLKVEVYGYVKADDQADSLDAVVRQKLNDLRADLIVAVEAFPYWTDATHPEPATSVLGPIEPVLVSQFTEPAGDWPDGFLVLEFQIRYLFNRKNP